MKMIFKQIATGLVLVSMACTSWANGSGLLKRQGYSCVIEEVYVLRDSGSLEGGGYRSSKTFTIDRGTGRTIGAIKNYNTTSYGDFQPKVIDRGNHEQYFKALTIYGSHNPSIDVLVVQEFADSKLKPFLFTHNGEVTTGVCENI